MRGGTGGTVPQLQPLHRPRPQPQRPPPPQPLLLRPQRPQRPQRPRQLQPQRPPLPPLQRRQRRTTTTTATTTTTTTTTRSVASTTMPPETTTGGMLGKKGVGILHGLPSDKVGRLPRTPWRQTPIPTLNPKPETRNPKPLNPRPPTGAYTLNAGPHFSLPE